ncbi:hypothetical protein Fmac_025219 [Flemingia macrophylla]|uniref:Heparanase-like protein 2 n=1 Tax=Flemingia macrophylla TaxID=520843 RepID=A0ABD1LRK7_9FABA
MKDVKVSLCYLVLFLFSLSSAEDVKLVVKGVTSIATTDNNFICATLDWWPANKCDYGDCPWGQTSILNMDLSNKILTNAIKAFNPLRIRLGGSVEDQIVYQFGKQKKCPHFKKKEGGLFGFKAQRCLPKKRWDEVHDFFNKTGVKLSFGLNALTGKKNSVEDKLNWVGNWNPKNAISLMKYTISKGYKIDSYELGARVDSVQYAMDITRLRHIVNLLYPDASRRPKVLGPGGFYGKEWFQSFLLNVALGVVDGVTHHIYNLGAVKEFTPWAAPWVGEAGGAYNSGSKDLSHTFVNGFCAYAHCSKNRPGVTVLFINMSNFTTFNISLVDDMNLNPILETLPGRVQKTMREEYHLTPKDGNIQSDVVLLNGTPLQLTKSLDIPEMKLQLVDASSPIIAKPDSIIFIHTNGFKAPTCG